MHFFKNYDLVNQLNEEKIKSYLRYTLGEVRELSFVVIPEGWENIAVKVNIEGEKYLLRISSMKKHHRMFSKAEQLIREELNYMIFLRDNHIPVPKIFKTLQDKKLYKMFDTDDNVIFIILMEFIEGKHSFYNYDMVRKTAELQAKMHEISRYYVSDDFSRETKNYCNDYSAMSYRMNDISKHRTVNFPKKLYLELLYIYKKISPSLAEYYKSNVRYLIHSDIKSDNILVHEGDIKAIIDFGDLRWSVAAEDLGTYIWDMCNVLFDEGKDFKIYLNDYFESYRNNSKEFRNIDEIMAINYAIDRYLIINLYYLVENQRVEEKIKYQINKAHKQLLIIRRLLEIKEKKLKRINID